MTKTRAARVLVSSEAPSELHPVLRTALELATRATSARHVAITEATDGEELTGAAPLGIDGLCLLFSSARPKEMGLLDRTAALVRQAWVWSTIAAGHDSSGGAARRANFLSWLGEKMRHTIDSKGDLSLLMVELEHHDVISQMYGSLEVDERVPVLYDAVERAVRGVDSVYRCDDTTIAVVLPRCNRANAAKVAERVHLGLRQDAARGRRGAVGARIRTYSHPGELAAFATGATEAQVRAGQPTWVVPLWCGFIAGALDANVSVAAQREDAVETLVNVGPTPDGEMPTVLSEALRAQRPILVPRTGGERAKLAVPIAGQRDIALLLDAAAGGLGPADIELLGHLAEHLAPFIGQLKPDGRAVHDIATDASTKDTRKLPLKFDGIIGTSPAMHEVFELLERVVQTDYPVIIQGESGTGKELIARAIHFNGARADKPLIAENCAALNDNLLEAELFGYEKGSFTGAETSRKGLFELADGGTLFLDEVADMKSGMQKDLLRILQEGIVRPVGGKQFRKVDVRIICASNKDLATLVDEGKFRSDLYYRLNVWSLRMPPLRERLDTVPSLVEHFLQKIAKQTGTEQKRLGRGVLEALVAHDWPGNVRELRNEIARMVAMTQGEEILARDFSKRPSSDAPRATVFNGDEIQTLEDIEKAHILRALRYTNGNRARAAEILGINKATIYRKLKQYGMDV